MASTLVDLVKITANSVGTGAITLGAAVTGYRGVEALTNGDTYSYAIQQVGTYEFGRGTYLAATQTLTRTPFASSGGGSAINLQPNAEVAFVMLAEDLTYSPLPSSDLSNVDWGTVSDATLIAMFGALENSGVLAPLAPTSYGLPLFTDISTATIPSSVKSFTTSGCSSDGTGAGTYVNDTLATAIGTSAPKFCAEDLSGRFWRLKPTLGMIAISQGGALGGTNNDQPATQAAFDYAKLIACRTVLADFDTVSIWNTVRTSSAGQLTTDAFAQDGQSIWITAPVRFLGLATQTHVKLLSTTGTSLETGWQNVGGNVWRGSGINLMGGTSGSPNANNLTFFVLENIWLDGGCAYTQSSNSPTPTNPDGRDLTNKGIRLQGTQLDNFAMINSKIGGFKGETYYMAGTTQTLQTLRKFEMYGSNQSTFNPSTGSVDAEDGYIHDCQAVEILGGIGGRMVNIRSQNIVQISVQGGQSNGTLYNYGYPTRLTTQAPPWFDFIDCDFQNCAQIIPANYVRFKKGCTATDTSFYLQQATSAGCGAQTSTYGDIAYTIDQANANPILLLQGPTTLTTLVPGAPAGTFIQKPADIHWRFDVHRTAYAIAQGYFADVFVVGGNIDETSCSFAIGEADGVAVAHDTALSPSYGGLIKMPLITMDGPTSSQTIGGGRPLGQYPLAMTSGPYSLVISNPRHSLLNTSTAAAIAVTAATSINAAGQKCRIYWDAGSTAGTTYTFAATGAGWKLNSACTLSANGDWLEVELNPSTGLWHESGRMV